MIVEKAETLMMELAKERLTSASLRVELATVRRERDDQAAIAEMARKKLSKENDELRAGLRQANEIIASNLEMAQRLADALAKTSGALEGAHRGMNVLSAFIEYQAGKK